MVKNELSFTSVSLFVLLWHDAEGVRNDFDFI
jgi:hypothetical protein